MISAKIIADSVNQKDHRLTTLEVVMPRIILAEFNTHRMFSRNSASSRAIPVERQIEMVMHNPFIPLYWGRNQKGMQAHHELSENERAAAEIVWLYARDKAVTAVNSLMQMER